MKKTFFIILSTFIIITIIISSYIHNARRLKIITERTNKHYEQYYNKQIIGTSLISLINKAIDDNEKNEVLKQENSIYYEDNNINSIHITVEFMETNKIIKMEDIAEKKSENFVKFFSSTIFECTKVEYHKKTNHIKSLHFEQSYIDFNI